jgi:hypothetical protein
MSGQNLTSKGDERTPLSFDPAPMLDAHPRPSTLDALERSKARQPTRDRTRRRVWLWFWLAVVLLVVVGLALGLRRS